MTKPKPRLTVEALQKALEPVNNCRVKAFLESIDAESRVVLEKALAMSKTDLPAPAVLSFIEAAGYESEIVPGIDAIANHRSGRGSCRCRG